jgi:hypothetical protein
MTNRIYGRSKIIRGARRATRPQGQWLNAGGYGGSDCHFGELSEFD